MHILSKILGVILETPMQIEMYMSVHSNILTAFLIF